MSAPDPHAGRPVLRRGRPLAEAGAAVLLVHGRGAGAIGIVGLAEALARPDLAFLAPDAAGGTWYPSSFLAPRQANEPWLSSALRRLGGVLDEVAAAGLPAERTVVAGFSQGACLACELVVRRPARYGALLAFTGGLPGAPGEVAAGPGDLAGTPVYLAAGDPDPHVPWARVEETAAVLRAMGAEVTLRRFPGRPHDIDPREIAEARALLDRSLGEAAG